MDSRQSVAIKKIVFWMGLLIFLVCLYIVIKAIVTAETTGILTVTTSDSGAAISISQNNRQAKIIGTGTAKTHLKPGTYQIVASSGGSQAATTVSVKKKQDARISLQLGKKPLLPSVDSINFSNTDALIDNGVTENQLTTLKLDFFEFNTSEQTVNIDPASIQVGTPNYNTSGAYPLFSKTFKVTIDSKLFNAEILTSGPDNLELYLRDPSTNAIVFDS